MSPHDHDPSAHAGGPVRVTIGPLHYELDGSDEWAARALGDLRAHLQIRGFDGPPRRRVVYAGIDHGPRRAPGADRGCAADRERGTDDGPLPAALHALAPGLPRDGWRQTDDDGTSTALWYHPNADVSFVTPRSSPSPWRVLYRLPWQAILRDVVALGGAIVHSAVALHHGGAYLFTAPPGGGKTTTVARLPRDWTLLGDDGCLLWPDSGAFMTSPLPTWSHALGVGDALPGVTPWRVAESARVSALTLLVKDFKDSIARLDPLDATVAFYRALCEHPVALGVRTELRAHLLETVGAVVESVPCYEVRLRLGAEPLDGILSRLAHGD